MSDEQGERPAGRRMRVVLARRKADYIHNDIANAAHYFRNRIAERIGNDDRSGIFLEMMAGLTMTAFAIEANLNFVGARVVKDWNEMQSSERKFKLISETLRIDVDYERRPFSTIHKLKKFRDTLAHGKPRILEEAEEAIGTYDELYARNELKRRSDWEEYVTPEFVAEAYTDMNEIWIAMCKAANIDVVDTLGVSGSGMTFIEHVE